MISRLHYITQDLANYSHAQLAEFACKGGADWVQLRVKHALSASPQKGERELYDEWLKIAKKTKLVCQKYGAKLIINDNVQIAKEVGADGVHLGKDDMNPKEARKILGKNFIIGGSTNTMDDVRRMMENGVDYIGIGPYSFTSTKEKLNPVLGLEGIRAIAEKFGNQIPMIAIGGIKLKNVESLMQTGIHGVAVSSAINMEEDKSEVTSNFITSLREIPLRNNEAISWK
jgi:thiamine-phosphate pyrophosphorylase